MNTQTSAFPGTQALFVDVISDVICPWCFVGKRQLEQALATRIEQYPDAPITQVRWHPYQLNPDMPAGGMTRADYLASKFGDSDGGDAYANVRAAAWAVGLTLHLDKVQRQPNTIRAHALIAMAQDVAQDTLVEALFNAYFVDGQDVGEDGVLIDIGRQGGLAEPVMESALADDSVHDTIRRADAQARELGVTGVPFFIFNQRLAVSGAVGADTLLAAAEKVLAEPDDTADGNSSA